MEDEVDRIVAAWRRERPDLPVGTLQVLSRVTRLARHLERLRREEFARHGLSPYEFDVLAALRRAGPPYALSPGAIVARTLVGSATTTNRVDRLETRGLVRRRPHPHDGRGVLVELTASGRDAVDAAVAGLLDRERDLLAGLDQERQAAVAAALRDLLAPLDDCADP